MLKDKDIEIYNALEAELHRQQDNIELIASENIVSREVLEAQGSVLTNKYAEGYPSRRYYGGCEYVDIVENIAIERAKALFNCGFANVQPHSGSQANMAVYTALLTPGDTVMGMSLDMGGHLTHGSSVNFSGKLYHFVSYGCLESNGLIDYDTLKATAEEIKPKLIVAGASCYPRIIDFKKMADIAHSVGAYLMVDIAHIAGLVAAGVHPSPFPYADVVTTTTHKTLRGPRGGMILTNNEELSKKINKAIFPGIQGGPLMHVIAAKAVALGEDLKPEFKDYIKQVVKNAYTLAEDLKSLGYKLVTDGTDNHLMSVDIKGSIGKTGKEAETILDKVGITVNKESIPGDTEKPTITSGIRIGTPAVTSRGFKEHEMHILACLIDKALRCESEEGLEAIHQEELALAHKFPIYED